MKIIKKVIANHFNINCIKNDLVDIKCGGPEYLGFDFYVDSNKDTEEIKKLIEEEIKNKKFPFI